MSAPTLTKPQVRLLRKIAERMPSRPLSEPGALRVEELAPQRYPTLRRLVDAGLVEQLSGGGWLHITPAGRAALARIGGAK